MIIKTSPDEIENFLTDAANVKGYCDAVYFPESESEVIEAVKLADRDHLSLTVSGNGTGLTGGRVPKGGIVLSTERLNNIKEISKEGRYAIVEPGVILKDFQETVESKGLFYPPDPTERNCFIGATVATNSSGAKTFKYGPTRNYVIGLNVVLADGELLRLERGKCKANGYVISLQSEGGKQYSFEIPDYKMPQTKHAAGYYCHKDMDAIDLFIGSEGTLGIITEIKVKLLDIPENILSAVVFFEGEEDGLNFIEEARNLSYKARLNGADNQIDARGLEYFDENSLQMLREDYPQIPQGAKSGVWFEQEINDSNEEDIFTKWLELVAKFNANEETAWFASNSADREKFKDFRHSISWKISEFIAHRNITKVGTDIAVPDDKFRGFLKEMVQSVKKENLDYVVYGHFGNSHAHLNMLPKDQIEFVAAKKLYMQICTRAVELSGTISAEHGIGKLKKEYLLMMFGEENIKKMAKLKSSLDPKHIFGIGNIFDEKYL